MKNVFKIFFLTLIFASGCGKNSSNKPITNFELNVPKKDTVDLNLHLNPKYNLPFDEDFSIPFLGELRLHKGQNGNGATVGVKIDFELLIKKYGEFMPTKTLPNGSLFPKEIVNGNMVQIDVPALHYPSEKVTFMEPFVYAGIENEKRYVAIALSFRLFGLGKRIEGKSISDIMSANDLPIFGATIFGPGNDSIRNRTSLGGMFFVVDVTNAIATNSMTEKNLNSKIVSNGMGYFDLKYIDNLLSKIK